MRLYLDAGAIVKRYAAEPGSDAVHAALLSHDRWLTTPLAFTEVVRALSLGGEAGSGEAARFRQEWPLYTPVAVDQALVERAAELAVSAGLRTLDAIHLASALTVGPEELLFATWDGRLHAAAARRGLQLLPAAL